MDNKFLDKVVDQILSETRIDYGMGEIQFPFSLYPLLSPPFTFSLLLHLFHLNNLPSSFHRPALFSKHSKDVYGLNDDEIKYVWKEYRDIIKDKIENNG